MMCQFIEKKLYVHSYFRGTFIICWMAFGTSATRVENVLLLYKKEFVTEEWTLYTKWSLRRESINGVCMTPVDLLSHKHCSKTIYQHIFGVPFDSKEQPRISKAASNIRHSSALLTQEEFRSSQKELVTVVIA